MRSDFDVQPLSPATWPAFARLVERHKGVWGGCWCMGFHADGLVRSPGGSENRRRKQVLVQQGRAHAALVFDGEEAIGWCQFGPASELTRIKHRRLYEQGLQALPDWRITCFFVDRQQRGRGVAAAALHGALAQIAALGGGLVESYPEDTTDRRPVALYLYNATLSIFEAEGFTRDRQIGKHHWVMRKQVAAAGGGCPG